MLRKGFFLLVVFGLIAGCHLDSNDDTALSAEFAVKDKFGQASSTFTVGEEVTLEITVTNHAAHPVTYTATGPGYDMVITQGSTRIWSAFADQAFATVITERTIDARDTLVLTATWLGTDDNGVAVTPGVYTVTPQLVFYVADTQVAPPDPVDITLN